MENETMVSKGGLSAAYTDKWEQRASIRTRPVNLSTLLFWRIFPRGESADIFG